MSLTVHTPAPTFTLSDQEGRSHHLSDYQGSWLLLYFYPKDDTPGCTTQACTLRDAWADLQAADLKVLGVSADSLDSHRRFADKYNLPFPILSDPNKELMKSYGVLGEKSMFGKKYLGIRRMSFLIDPQGKIAKIYHKVQPARHAAEVLADLQTLKSK